MTGAFCSLVSESFVEASLKQRQWRVVRNMCARKLARRSLVSLRGLELCRGNKVASTGAPTCQSWTDTGPERGNLCHFEGDGDHFSLAKDDEA
jgi:hypothetical protein